MRCGALDFDSLRCRGGNSSADLHTRRLIPFQVVPVAEAD